MEPSEYLDFDEAVTYLKTTSSTLYKWLQSGKIAGHKLGRQWRFTRNELELHISGAAPPLQLVSDRAKLSRKINSKLTTETLINQLIWSAFDSGSRLIHFVPAQGRYEIRLRNKKDLTHFAHISPELFAELERNFCDHSTPLNDEGARRSYLQRSENPGIQIRYQKLETVLGARVTLHIWEPAETVIPLESFVRVKSTLTTLRQWLEHRSGIIVICGAPASGKTTTVYSMLNELSQSGRTVFTLESPVEVIIENVNQIELNPPTHNELTALSQKIMSSDADVICFGLGSQHGVESSILTNAHRAASTGHLVLVLLHATSKEDVEQILARTEIPGFRKLVLGISHQELTSESKVKFELC